MKPAVAMRLALLSFAAMLFLPGLQGIAKYRALPLPYLKSGASKDAGPQISFAYKQYDKNDCKTYLGRGQIIDRSFQPIQLLIKNNTNRTLEISLDTFSFPCISFLQVADEVYFNTRKRLILWGVGAVFVPILLVPFILEAVESPRANSTLETDYAKKALQNQEIEPYGTINAVIFVHRAQYTSSFSFVLTDPCTNQRFELSTEQPILRFE